MPIGSYEEEYAQPYLVDYLGLQEFYDNNLADAENRVKEINNYILYKIQKEGYDPTISSYRRILGELETSLNLTNDHNRITRLNLIWYNLLPKIKKSKIDKKLGI